MKEFAQHISGLTSDSRAVKPGYCFAALKGEKFDGRDFIADAVASGATYILAERGTLVPENITAIESDNPRRDFAHLAAAFYGAQPDQMIAVTGTNGKTSVVDFVRQILELLQVRAASLGTLGFIAKDLMLEATHTTADPVTLHRILAQAKENGIEALAMEASSHGLDQYRLDGVALKVAAFTNLTQDHLDYHGDMESYFAAKSRLFTDLLPTDGTTVINGDDPYGARLKANVKNAITYGAQGQADLKLLLQKPTAQGQDLSVSFRDKTYDFSVPLTGAFQAGNILCAAACCMALGHEPDTVFDILPHLKTVPGRVELAAHLQNRAAYIDYAHTPDALEKLLQSLRPHTKGRIICVFGVGGNRDAGKRPLMGKAVFDNADMAIITDDNPRFDDPDQIRADVQATCPTALTIADRRAAILKGVELLQENDILIIAGKGHETGQSIQGKTYPFDDLKVTKDLMEQVYDG